MIVADFFEMLTAGFKLRIQICLNVLAIKMTFNQPENPNFAPPFKRSKLNLSLTGVRIVLRIQNKL